MGWADEIGSGLRNTNKFLPLYIPGAKPVFSENDTFTTIIPLIFLSLKTYAQQLAQWLVLADGVLPHLQKGLSNVSLPVSLKDASWKDLLLHLVPGWHKKGTNLPVLDWPENHPFTRSFVSKQPVTKVKSTNLIIIACDDTATNGTNLTDNDTTAIQSLIHRGEEKVPTWDQISTHFIHKKVVYLISILALCSEPIRLNDLMRFINYANRKTFRDNYLSPLRQAGFIDLISTEKNDPNQMNFLTKTGKAFLAGQIQHNHDQ